MRASIKYRVLVCSCSSGIDSDALTSFKQNLQVLKQVVHKAKDVSMDQSALCAFY